MQRVYPNRENVNGMLTPCAGPGFAFTFKIIYGVFKAPRHLQPETHNCHVSRSFTQRSPKCYVLMGGSGAKHREITNTYRTNRSWPQRGKLYHFITHSGPRRLITPACQQGSQYLKNMSEQKKSLSRHIWDRITEWDSSRTYISC